jgi:DNA replication and repair protein RecF
LILKSLKLFQFRNFLELDWQPHPKANLLVGSNAQGKTNLLESIFLLGTTKSFRQAKDDEIIMQDKPESKAQAVVFQEQAQVEREVEVLLRREDKKTVRLNGKPVSRHSEILGNLSVVLFTPEDLQLVKAGPAARRAYLDLEISQASATYLKALQIYHRTLRQRNAALKWLAEGRNSSQTVEAFEEELIQSGCQILKERLRAVRQLAPLAAEAQRLVSGEKEILSLRYVSSLDLSGREDLAQADLPAMFKRRLREMAREEVARRATLVGPHRDDLEILIQARPARAFGSQGQQRTAALALKLAEVAYLRGCLGENPVLLLDDVFSELDSRRKQALLDLLDTNVQTFLTSAQPDPPGLAPGLCLEIKDGRLAGVAS